MKGLIKTSIILIALIIIGGGVSVVVYNDLTNRLAAAYERGQEEGYLTGYTAGFGEGSRVAYQEGSKVGYAKGKMTGDDSSNEDGFYFLYNPTNDEVHEILAKGEMGSAKGIHDYAEANGIRVAYVRCPIAREAAEGRVYLYQLVAFETIDKGLIIIEPRSHLEVKIEVGKSYRGLNGFPPVNYDDTITKITIVW